MTKSISLFVAACVAAAVAGCGDVGVAPTRDMRSVASAARATAPSLSASPVSASQISLSWPDDAHNELGWEVHRSSTGANGNFSLVASLPANSTQYDNTGLASLTQYCYKVRSFRKTGPNTSYAAFTGVACATTFGPPAAPSGVTARPRTSTVVDVSWADIASTEQAYRVERSASASGPWSTAATLSANATTYADLSRTPEVLVCYRVVAANAYGESLSNPQCTAPPLAPSTVTATANAPNIIVSWIDESGVEDGYEVQRSLDGSVWSVLATVTAGVTTYNDATVTPDVRQWYRVRAKKDGGFSDFSGSAWAAVGTKPPSAPTLYSAAPGNSTTAAVMWYNVDATATAIRIERSEDNQLSWVTAGSVPAVGDTRFWDEGRTPEQLVCYRVVATNSFGDSPASNVDCTVPPAGPTNMIRDVYGVYFTDNSNVEEYYEIWFTYCYSEEECYWDMRRGAANSTFAFLEEWEIFGALYAVSDGGYSDPGTWAETPPQPSMMRISAGRPTKGARAPRPATARLTLRPRGR